MLMFALSAALLAQPAPGPQSAPQAKPAPPGRTIPDAQIMAMLHQMRVARLQQSLGLSEDRAKAMAERWSRWDREFMERGRQMQLLRAQFNGILIGPGSEEEKGTRLKPLVEQFLGLRQQQDDAKRRFETEILQPLGPAQQARMILLVEDIQAKIRETLRENRHNGGHF
jgi:hypothetical protein